MRFQNRNIVKIVVALLVIGWVGFIFYMSSQTAVNSGNMSRSVTLFLIKASEKIGVLSQGPSNHAELVHKYESTVRSLAHMGMYFLLCLILSLVLKFWGLKRWAFASFTVCLAISILDELNQMHFEGRNDSGKISSGMEDLFKDVFGTIAALIVALIIINLVNWLKAQRKNSMNNDVNKKSQKR